MKNSKTSSSVPPSAKVAKSASNVVSWKDRLSKQDEVELKGVFDLFDEDHGGTIDPVEVQQILNELGLKDRSDIVFDMINSLKDVNRPINFDEFLNIICSKVGDCKSRDGITRVFQLWDTQNNGFADFQSFKHVAKELGQTMNDGQLKQMMHNAYILNGTQSHDNFNFEEFYNIVTKKNQKN